MCWSKNFMAWNNSFSDKITIKKNFMCCAFSQFVFHSILHSYACSWNNDSWIYLQHFTYLKTIRIRKMLHQMKYRYKKMNFRKLKWNKKMKKEKKKVFYISRWFELLFLNAYDYFTIKCEQQQCMYSVLYTYVFKLKIIFICFLNNFIFTWRLKIYAS